MKQLLVGIFAHPDDETFGPCATLMKEVASGSELHLISVTDGEGGANNEHHESLARVRRTECEKAAEAIGASSVLSLGYPDGGLCNNLYHRIADKIEHRIRELCSGSEPIELRLMTFDMNGLSGHLDHIAVSYIVTYVFVRLKNNPPHPARATKLLYYCLSEHQQPTDNDDYFVHMPKGRPAEFIDEHVDVREYLVSKYDAMRIHHSQRHDAEMLLSRGDDYHATDHFHCVT